MLAVIVVFGIVVVSASVVATVVVMIFVVILAVVVVMESVVVVVLAVVVVSAIVELVDVGSAVIGWFSSVSKQLAKREATLSSALLQPENTSLQFFRATAVSLSCCSALQSLTSLARLLILSDLQHSQASPTSDPPWTQRSASSLNCLA